MKGIPTRTADLRIALFSGNYNMVRDGANQALNRLVAYLLREASETSWYSKDGTLWAKLVVDNAAGLKISLGSNAPPGFGAGGVPVGALLDVSKADGEVSLAAKVAAN